MMKHSIICRSDAETQRTRTHKQPRAGRWPLATLAGLILAAVTVPPAWSAVTNPPTGPINGTVPFLKTEEPERSRLYVADQDGNTVGTTPENSVVNIDHTPSSFNASTTETLDIFPDDLDGDCDTTGGFRPACDVAVGGTTNRVWKYNGNVITATQLSSPFKTYFAGKSLKVTVTAPVTTTSHTGAPTVGVNPLSSDETLVHVPPIPGIYVGTYYWDSVKSFPTTAAVGMHFTISLDGLNGPQPDFNWVSNQPSWISVVDGIVTITGVPTTATKTVTITATNKNNSSIKSIYTFTVNKWFETVRLAAGTSLAPTSRDVIDAKCNSKVSGLKAAGYTADLRGSGPAASFRKVPGTLIQEWGLESPPSDWSPSGGAFVIAYMDSTVGLDYSPASPYTPLEQAVGAAFYSKAVGITGVVPDPDGYTVTGAWVRSVGAAADAACYKTL